MLQQDLAASAFNRPDHVAIAAGRRSVTYQELEEAATRVARGLQAHGVSSGDRVAIDLENGIEAVIAIYAVLKAGAAFVMINPSTKSQKLAYVLSHAGARALFIDARTFSLTQSALEPFPDLTVIVVGSSGNESTTRAATTTWASLLNGSPEPLSVDGADGDLAALLYTSGSTGEPKGVMLTHANIMAASSAIATYLRLTADDVILNVLPLSFGYGLTQLFPLVMVGGSLVVERGIQYPHVTLTEIAKRRATGLAIVPTIASTLLGLDLSKYDLSSLRYVTNAGAGLPPAVVRRLRESLPDVNLIPMYGQTECLRISYLEPDQVDRRPDSVGRGMPNQELDIIDEHGQSAAPGVMGELVVRGPHVMQGYWRQPDETAKKLRGGDSPASRVLHTGDLFKRDEDGYYYFVARQDDIIKSRGEKVSPREVENVIYRIAGVAEAAVVGVPDARLGEAIKAFVVLRPGAAVDVREIKRYCATHLEDYMVPSLVEFLDALPKNERGKVLTRDLVASV